MSLLVQAQPLPMVVDADGVIRIGGTRVTLDTIVAAFREGMTAESIVGQYPSLGLAEVYLVIGYFLSHQDEVNAYLGDRQQLADEVCKSNEARFDPDWDSGPPFGPPGPELSAMLPLMADENFNNDVVRGVLRRQPAVDLVRVQDVGLSGADDSTVLEWASQNGRVLLTHDAATMTRYAYDRVRNGKAMPGVFEVGRHVPIGTAIEEIILLAECSLEGEWEGQVHYLPLR